MSNVFIAGIGGILLSGVFATVLMLANAEAYSGSAGACSFSSGYGIGHRACRDSLSQKVSPPPVTFGSVMTKAPA